MKKVRLFMESMYHYGCWLIPFLRYENRTNYIPKESQQRSVTILANGPSLKTFVPLTTDTDYCTVNHSPLDALFFEVKPKYHVLVDGGFFHGDESALVAKLNEVTWDMKLLVPYRDREVAQKVYCSNPHITMVPIHFVGLHDQFHNRKKAFRLFIKGWALPSPQNVSVAAVYCMINAGYRTINLYGTDHSWISNMAVDDNNIVCRKDVHYYDKTVIDYTPIIIDGSYTTMCQELRSQADTFGAHQFLQEYAESMGVRIVNYTEGSFIDAYPRGH